MHRFLKKQTKLVIFLSFTVFIFGSLAFGSYTNEAFDELANAIRDKLTKSKIMELEEKYKDKRVEGKGYITSITKNVEDNIVINLSTEEQGNEIDAVSVVVILRKYLRRQASRLKIGGRTRFFGVFKEIRMNSIIIEDGIIKGHQ